MSLTARLTENAPSCIGLLFYFLVADFSLSAARQAKMPNSRVTMIGL
jgi:hypothetical protein